MSMHPVPADPEEALAAPRTCAIEVRAVLFDLDGVLVDSTASVERLWRGFARRHGLDGDALLRDLHGRRMVDIVGRALPHLGPDALADEVARQDAEEAADAIGATDALPGAVELTARLSEAGAAWAIVTSGTDAVSSARIASVGLPAPPTLVTADQVDAGKPAPDPYELAAARLGVEARECLVIEDAPSGLRAGSRAGATTAAVTTSHDGAELGLADHLIRTVADVTLRAAAVDAGAGADAPVRLTFALRCLRRHGPAEDPGARMIGRRNG